MEIDRTREWSEIGRTERRELTSSEVQVGWLEHGTRIIYTLVVAVKIYVIGIHETSTTVAEACHMVRNTTTVAEACHTVRNTSTVARTCHMDNLYISGSCQGLRHRD